MVNAVNNYKRYYRFKRIFLIPIWHRHTFNENSCGNSENLAKNFSLHFHWIEISKKIEINDGFCLRRISSMNFAEDSLYLLICTMLAFYAFYIYFSNLYWIRLSISSLIYIIFAVQSHLSYAVQRPPKYPFSTLHYYVIIKNQG